MYMCICIYIYIYIYEVNPMACGITPHALYCVSAVFVTNADAPSFWYRLRRLSRCARGAPHALHCVSAISAWLPDLRGYVLGR